MSHDPGFFSGPSGQDPPSLRRFSEWPPEVAASAITAESIREENGSGLGAYRLLRKLGRGEWASAWKAIRIADRMEVAIKVVGRHHIGDARDRSRFDREHQTLAQADHPGIVNCIDRGVLPSGQLWYATEYVPGLSVLDFANRLDEPYLRDATGRRPRRFPICAVLELFVRVCESVEAAHRVGVIHGDLKPTNIIVNESGQPRLLDFGLGRGRPAVEDDACADPFIRSSVWAAPEQLEGRVDRIDVRTDVYSLGVVLYQMLTGTFPYDVRAPLATMLQQILLGNLKPPQSRAGWIDRDVQCIVMRALALERQRRYQSVAELRADIDRYLRGEPIRARGDGVWYGAVKLVRRHRAAAAAVATVFGLTLVYSLAVTLLYQRTVAAEAMAKERASDARLKFRQAHQAAEFLVGDIDRQLKDTIGASELRVKLLSEAHGKLAELIRERTDDPELQGDFADVQVKLSDIALALGQLDEAETRRREVLEIRQRLVDKDPENPDLLERLSIATVLVGNIADERGNSARALACYETALAIDEKLVARFPDSDHLRDILTWSYERVGVKLLESDPARGREYLRKRHVIVEGLAERFPEKLEFQFGLLASYMLMSTQVADDPRERAEYAIRAAKIADRLVRADPQNTQYAHYYILAHNWRGDLAVRSCRPELAPEHWELAAQAAHEFHEAEPGHLLFKQLEAECQQRSAERAEHDGDFAGARAHWESALTLYLSLLEHKRSHIQCRAAVCHAMRELMTLLAQSGQPRDDTWGSVDALVQRGRDLLPAELPCVQDEVMPALEKYQAVPVASGGTGPD